MFLWHFTNAIHGLPYAISFILFIEKLQIQGQLLSFFMEDVFGQLQLQVRREIHFVEEFHSLRQKLSRCLSTHCKYREFDPGNLPRKQHVESCLHTEGWVQRACGPDGESFTRETASTHNGTVHDFLRNST